MLDIILYKIKKHLDLTTEEQEILFIAAFEGFLNNTDPVALPFIKINIENILSGYITEESAMSATFIDQVSTTIEILQKKPVLFYADGVYFLCRYFLQKRKVRSAMHFCVLFLSSITEEEEESLDIVTLSYLHHFAMNHDEKESNDLNKMGMALRYSAIERQKARQNLTQGFLDDPFECLFMEYEPQVRRIMALASLAHIETKNPD
jgi:hypothetical protein